MNGRLCRLGEGRSNRRDCNMSDKICPNCERLKLELQKAEQEIGRQKRLKRIERNKVKRLAAELEKVKGDKE